MFQGFCDATMDFMWGIRFNNERPWFEAHKEDYQTYLYQPMKDLAREVYDGFQERNQVPGLCWKVSRIYRDARRLHGRGPYKDHLWWSMEHPTQQPFATRPVFWFELTPGGWSYGLGYYAPSPLTMAKFRARLDNRPRQFEPLARQIERQSTFQLTGEDYKRAKGDPGPLLAPWYNKRQLALECSRKPEPILYTRDLVGLLLEGYQLLLPLYQYFSTLEGDPDPRQPV
ncbi:DUF2461 domain-containing protein [Pseudoflavonifractor sp. 524-17]|uniref:DUF2461 domain-containing protein n=1 Tax=Pseudoflavonifractor sp. 524-17 TaxID=2304577 RepID=UPI001379AFB0|nr:DUF2461 domain-containing protein [Pseudoflavonifractor sp. 524-17]NCE65167.1 DUF2461 domain-containing protein [Pseudoflavonifractor sp. 524-17]